MQNLNQPLQTLYLLFRFDFNFKLEGRNEIIVLLCRAVHSVIFLMETFDTANNFHFAQIRR